MLLHTRWSIHAQPLADRRERSPPLHRAPHEGAGRLPEQCSSRLGRATVTRLPAGRAGLDIITDGEMRRESYSNRFATALDGVDMDNHGTALDRSGEPVPVPRVVGEIKRRHAVQVRDVEFLREHVSPDKKIKITVPGPFTMAQQAQDDHYGDGEARGGLAGAVNERSGPVRRRAEWCSLRALLRRGPTRRARTGSASSGRSGGHGPPRAHRFGNAAPSPASARGLHLLPELAASDVRQISRDRPEPAPRFSILCRASVSSRAACRPTSRKP